MKDVNNDAHMTGYDLMTIGWHLFVDPVSLHSKHIEFPT